MSNSPCAERPVDPLLEAQHVSYRFGSRTVLSDLSLALRSGEIFGLIGPDGAGKTTALRALAGLVRPRTGSVWVASASGSAASGSMLAYLPQGHCLYGELTIEENLRFFARIYGLSVCAYRSRRDQLLTLTGLERFAKRRAAALSGGMYKKLALACVLIARPGVVLLDEPTNGVDPLSRRQLWALLSQLAHAGTAALVSTPDLDEAAQCHRVALLDEGRTVLQGEPRRLLARFDHQVFDLFDDGSDRLERLLATVSLKSAVAGGCLRVVVPDSAVESFVRQAVRAGVALRRRAPAVPDLYQVATRSGANGARERDA